LDEDDEDVKNLMDSAETDPPLVPPTRSSSSSKRTRRSSKTSTIHDKNNEYIFDEEHLIELLKRLKQQPGHIDDGSTLLETLISKYQKLIVHIFLNFILELHPSSADLIRDRFGTIFEIKGLQSKEFTPNIDHSTLALDTTIENTLHSYFMLFCRRCHRYDCFLHKDKQATPDLNLEPKTSNLIYRPCSRYCYRINPISQRRTKIEFKRSHSELSDNIMFKTPTNGFYPKRTKLNMIKTEPTNFSFPSNGFLIKPALKRKLTDELSEWSSSDKTLFRVFYAIYGDNICMIADLLDKPCSQVYVFYTNEMQINEKNSFLQRQCSTTSTSTTGSFSGINSTASSDSSDIKINGEHKKKKINGASKTSTSNGGEESIEEDSTTCNGKDEQHLVCENFNTSLSDFEDMIKPFIQGGFFAPDP
jgi:hypothetical protein